MRTLVPLTPKTANLAFLLLFPGFFFYHTALGLQIIPPIFGGYFSPVSLALTPLLLILYVYELHRQKSLLTPIDSVFFSYLTYFLLVIAVNSIFFDGDEEIALTHLPSILHLAALFIIFKFANFSSRTFWWVALGCWIGMTVAIFHLSSDGFFYLREQEATTNQAYVATYQGFGRSYFVTFLVLLPFITSKPLRLAICIVSVAALFVNGSRSEFVAAMVAVSLIEILRTRHRAVLLFGVVALWSILTIYGADLIDLLPENRTLQLLNLSESSSWEERNLSLHYALDTIMNSPVLGAYGSYLEIGGPGMYAHNIFSAWIDLGFAGFAWLLAMLLFPFRSLLPNALWLRTNEHAAEVLLALVLVAVTIFLLFTAKEFTYMLIGAALGRYANYSFEHKLYTSQFRIAALPVRMVGSMHHTR